MSSTSVTATATGTGPEVQAKRPTLLAWLGLGGLGLILVMAGLGWNWRVSARVDAQNSAQGDVATQVTALRSWFSSEDSAAVVPLPPVQQRLQQDAELIGGDAGLKVQQLAMLVQSWLPREKEINDARSADARLAASWQAWRTADSALGRQSTLTTGVWGGSLNPLRSELSQVDSQVLTNVFAPKADRASLQKQWSDRLAQYAGTAAKLSAQAAQDTGLNSAARQAVADWAQPLQETAQASQVLTASLATRVDAQSWPTVLTNLTNQVDQALGQMQGNMDLRHAQALMAAGVAVLVLAAIGLTLGLRRMRHLMDLHEQQHQASQASRRSLERITRQMRQIMRPDMAGDLGRTRIEESSRQPGYSLATLINQALDVREGINTQLAENDERTNRQVIALRRQIKELETATRERQGRADQAAQHHLQQAQGLASLSQKVRRCQEQAAAVWAGFRHSQTAVQETTFKTEAIRTKSQGAAKRIKRVGESTQSISVSMDVIKQLGLRIQLLSFNAAIEAPMAGGTGRNLAQLVQEIQSLAQSTDQTVKETEAVVRDIQEDAKQGVATMEQNTEDVVEANKRAHAAGLALQNIERQAQSMVDILNQLVEALETRALDDADLAEADKRDRTAVDRMVEQSGQINEALDALTQSNKDGAQAVRQRLNRLPTA